MRGDFVLEPISPTENLICTKNSAWGELYIYCLPHTKNYDADDIVSRVRIEHKLILKQTREEWMRVGPI